MLQDLRKELEKLAAAGRLRSFTPTGMRGAGYIEIRGKRAVDFTNWDLFGLNHERKFKRAVQSEVERSGLGSTASRLSSGTLSPHLLCEMRLAKFLGTEAVLLFSSKNQAILSLVTALANERDAVIIDELLQGPVSDAAYLVNAPVAVLPMNQVDPLEAELTRTKMSRRRLLFVESLSPISGLKSDLTALTQVAPRYEAELFLDESYALGILGSRGAGGYELSHLDRGISGVFGDLSLVFGAYGGFLAGPQILIDYVMNRSRTFQGEVSLPPAVPVAIEAAIDIIELLPVEREKLKQKAQRLGAALSGMGLATSPTPDSPIVCVAIQKHSLAQQFADALFAKGFLVDVVPRGTRLGESAVVRFLISSAHTDRHIEDVLQAVTEIWPKLAAV